MSAGFRRRVRVRTVQNGGRRGEVDFEADLHHALVLVHPSWSVKSITEAYLHVLDAACERALAAGRPVFWCPSGDTDSRVRWIVERVGVRPVKLFGGGAWFVKAGVNRRRSQREVDVIASAAGMSPTRMCVGFAGMYADACVIEYAASWCRTVRTNHPEEVEPAHSKRLPRRPFAEGIILSKLTVTA